MITMQLLLVMVLAQEQPILGARDFFFSQSKIDNGQKVLVSGYAYVGTAKSLPGKQVLFLMEGGVQWAICHARADQKEVLDKLPKDKTTTVRVIVEGISVGKKNAGRPQIEEVRVLRVFEPE